MIEMHISEIGFCSGHSASGVWVNEQAETTVPGLYAAGDMASVPHNYMLGAFVNGGIAGETAADYCAGVDLPAHDAADIAAEQARVLAPTRREDGITSLRDGVQDPAPGQRLPAAAEDHRARCKSGRSGSPRCARTSDQLVARDPHELMRALETAIDPRLRRSGGGGLALSHREPLGPLSSARGLSRDRQRNWFCHRCIPRTPGRHRPSQAADRSLYRADRRGRDVRLPPSAHQAPVAAE